MRVWVCVQVKESERGKQRERLLACKVRWPQVPSKVPWSKSGDQSQGCRLILITGAFPLITKHSLHSGCLVRQCHRRSTVTLAWVFNWCDAPECVSSSIKALLDTKAFCVVTGGCCMYKHDTQCGLKAHLHWCLFLLCFILKNLWCGVYMRIKSWIMKICILEVFLLIKLFCHSEEFIYILKQW